MLYIGAITILPLATLEHDNTLGGSIWLLFQLVAKPAPIQSKQLHGHFQSIVTK